MPVSLEVEAFALESEVPVPGLVVPLFVSVGVVGLAVCAVAQTMLSKRTASICRDRIEYPPICGFVTVRTQQKNGAHRLKARPAETTWLVHIRGLVQSQRVDDLKSWHTRPSTPPYGKLTLDEVGTHGPSSLYKTPKGQSLHR